MSGPPTLEKRDDALREKDFNVSEIVPEELEFPDDDATPWDTI